MKKFILYSGDAAQKTYMYPNGELATPERMKADYPAIDVFPHIILTDEEEQMCWAVQNLSGTRDIYGLSKTLTTDELIGELTALENTVAAPEDPPPNEFERIAAALELQNILAMPNLTE